MVRRLPRCLSPIGSAPVSSRQTKTLAATRPACNAKARFRKHIASAPASGERIADEERLKAIRSRQEQQKKRLLQEKIQKESGEIKKAAAGIKADRKQLTRLMAALAGKVGQRSPVHDRRLRWSVLPSSR